MTANTEVYPSKSSLIEGRLMLHEVAHDNNFNSSVTAHASMPLCFLTSISVSLLGWKAQPTINSCSSLISTKTTFSVSNLSSYRLNVLSSFIQLSILLPQQFQAF